MELRGWRGPLNSQLPSSFHHQLNYRLHASLGIHMVYIGNVMHWAAVQLPCMRTPVNDVVKNPYLLETPQTDQ